MSGLVGDKIKVSVTIEFDTADNVMYEAVASYETVLETEGEEESRELVINYLVELARKSAILEAYAEEGLLDQPDFLKEATVTPTEFDSVNMPDPERDRSKDEKAFAYSEADLALGEKHGSGDVLGGPTDAKKESEMSPWEVGKKLVEESDD